MKHLVGLPPRTRLACKLSSISLSWSSGATPGPYPHHTLRLRSSSLSLMRPEVVGEGLPLTKRRSQAGLAEHLPDAASLVVIAPYMGS